MAVSLSQLRIMNVEKKRGSISQNSIRTISTQGKYSSSQCFYILIHWMYAWKGRQLAQQWSTLNASSDHLSDHEMAVLSSKGNVVQSAKTGSISEKVLQLQFWLLGVMAGCRCARQLPWPWRDRRQIGHLVLLQHWVNGRRLRWRRLLLARS